MDALEADHQHFIDAISQVCDGRLVTSWNLHCCHGASDVHPIDQPPVSLLSAILTDYLYLRAFDRQPVLVLGLISSTD